MLKRIVMILAVAALMVMMVVANAAPVFAEQPPFINFNQNNQQVTTNPGGNGNQQVNIHNNFTYHCHNC